VVWNLLRIALGSLKGFAFLPSLNLTNTGATLPQMRLGVLNEVDVSDLGALRWRPMDLDVFGGHLLRLSR
jgi:hypothetical protein